MVSRLETPPAPEKLQENRLFAGIPTSLISDMGADVDLLHFDADDIIFQEGEAGDCLFLVVEGAVRISKEGRGGKQETLGFIQPGNFFGEMALIDGQPRSAQATAAEKAVLGQISSAAFARILTIAPSDLHMNFLRSVVERLRGINSHFIVELMRTERLSLVGTMANSIIHDLKNPIHVLQSCTELISSKTSDPNIIAFTDLMRKAVGNMTDMVQELLDFARGKSSLALSPHPAKAVIDELDAQLVRMLPGNVHLVREIRYCDDIDVDIGRFVRVLLNLIKNSIEAMPKGGAIRLGLRQEGQRAIFRVGDTGCGISPELQAQIFEPFVTYGKSKGTGLGMAIAKSVVESHAGTISVRSTVGVGTTVEVSIPTLEVGLPPE
jgi:signal transduction histidine kinase